MLNRKALAKSIQRLAAIYSETSLIGVSSTKSHLVFYIHDEGLLSLLRVPYKMQIPDCLVFTGALKTAIDQVRGDSIEINVSPDNQFLTVGEAHLAIRDSMGIDDLLKTFNTDTDGENLLPDNVCRLISTQFHTYVNTKPRSVFGWSLQINKGIAYYGSASQPLAKWGCSLIDAKDINLRIPDETCLRVHKIIPLAESIYLSKKVLRIDHDGISHYVTVASDHPTINLDMTIDLLQNEIKSTEAVNLMDPISNIIKFADTDSTVMLTIDNGKMVADVAGTMGKNRVDIAPFDKKFKFDARIKPGQLANMVTKNLVYVSLAFRDKKPFLLCFTENGHKAKSEEGKLTFEVKETVYMGALM
jgi:hypothetical protein